MFSSKKSFSKLRILPAIALGATLSVVGFNNGEAQATASSLSVSVTAGANPSVSLPQTAEGRFVGSSATTFQVSTTHAAGYTLTASATKLTDGTNTIATLSNGISADDFSNNTSYNNKWGFKPSVSYNETTGTTAANTNYLPAPITTTQTLAKTSDKTGGTYDISFGVRANNSAAEGTYTSTITVAVTGNPTPYTITYDANAGSDTVSGMPSNIDTSSTNETVTIGSGTPTRSGWYFTGWNTSANGDGAAYAKDGTYALDQTADSNNLTLYAQWTDCQAGYICYKSNAGTDTVEGTMANQSVGTSATSAMLQAYNFKRDGYAFLGWSTKENPTIGTDTIYGPMETISFSALSASGLKLYAVWLKADTTYNMQNFSADTCSSKLTAITYDSSTTKFTVSENSFIALKDTRDNNVYAVARLSDGNCWMLENLRLDDSVSAETIASGSQGVGGDFTKLAGSEDTNFSSSTTANSLYNTGNGYTMPRFNKNNTNIGGTNASGTALTPSYNSNNNSSQWYGYGNYYTWAAAKANTTAMNNASTSDSTTTSLCPTNWRLPVGNNSTADYSFGALSTSMGGTSATMSSSTTPTGAVMSARLRQFPNNFIYSGYWNSSSAYYRGTNGYYWSSTAYNSNLAYYLYLYSSGVYPGTSYYNKYYGLSVRCVAGS